MTAKQQTRKPAKPATAKETPVPTTPATPAPAAKPAAPAKPANCACGCGAPTITAKALFVSGHDARLAGVLGRALASNPADEQARTRLEALSPALQAKALSVKATADRKAAAKAAREAAKRAAKVAYDEAMAKA